LALGEKSPQKLRDEMSTVDWARWEAWFELHPQGPFVDDYRWGQLNANVVKYSGFSSRSDWEARDFMMRPPPKQPEPEMSDEDIAAALFAAYGAGSPPA